MLLRRSDRIRILIVFLSLLAVGIAWSYYRYSSSKLLAQTSRDTPVRGLAGDKWADIILGQHDFTQGTIKEVVGHKVNKPGGTLVDRSQKPEVLYVSDNGNNRILVYKSIGKCSNSPSIACTTNNDCLPSGGGCQLTINKPADVILGQNTVYKSSCNYDDSGSAYPNVPAPKKGSLCGNDTFAISPNEAGGFVGMAVDSQKSLFFPDRLNNRVLRYDNPAISDNMPDKVIGQGNFSTGTCNGGFSTPKAYTLCFGRNSQPGNWDSVVGVAVDSRDRLWVTDLLNNRVLMFSRNAKGEIKNSADFVLGQSSFTSNSPGSGLNKLNLPNGIAIGPDDSVYVTDGGNQRVIKYSPPLKVGMNGEIFGPASFGHHIAGITYDPISNGLWINEVENQQTVLWNMAGTQQLKVLSKDTYNGSNTGSCSNPTMWCTMKDARGTVGITSNGDVWISSSESQQGTYRYAYPIQDPTPGSLPTPDYALHVPPFFHNLITPRSFRVPIGIEVTNDQLIISDHYRLMFWNNPQQLSNWKNADGVIGAPNLNSEGTSQYGRVRADGAGHLYVAKEWMLQVFNLPLTSDEQPFKLLWGPFKTLEGTNFAFSAATGFDLSPDGTQLWIADSDKSRVFRVRNPLTNPKVDVVLGQLSPSGEICNRDPNSAPLETPPSTDPTTLCWPNAVRLDAGGNVWVSDHSLELRGNYRLMEYDASNFPADNIRTIYATPANRQLMQGHGTFELAFNSEGVMVVGSNDYYSPENAHHSLDYFLSPLSPRGATGIFEDFYAQPYTVEFDPWDNMYVADITRWRVQIYKDPF